MKLLMLVALISATVPTIAPAAWAPPHVPTIALNFDWLDPEDQPPPIALNGLYSIDLENVLAPGYGWYTRAILHGDLDTVAFLNWHIKAHVALGD